MDRMNSVCSILNIFACSRILTSLGRVSHCVMSGKSCNQVQCQWHSGSQSRPPFKLHHGATTGTTTSIVIHRDNSSTLL